MFTPFNFHDRDASRRRVQGVKLELGDDGTEPRYFGGRYSEGVRLKLVGVLSQGEVLGQENLTFSQTDLEPDLSTYETWQPAARNLSWINNFMPGWI